MEIKTVGGNVKNISGAASQTSVKKVSKSFAGELRASLEQGSAAAVPVTNKPIEYIIKKGDNLWNIGRKIFKVDPYQIARDNGLTNPNKLKIGQKLIINPSVSQAVKPRAADVVTASWYGVGHHNKKTASGQRFNMYQNTLAHKTLPMGTKVRLVNPDNGRMAEGVVNDRGPYIKGRDVDVSYALAKQLGFIQKGVTKLKMEKI